MNTAQETAVKFFKRNPEATVAHIVLMKAFSKAAMASAYRKSVSAKTVTVVLRDEVSEPLGETKLPEENTNEQ